MEKLLAMNVAALLANAAVGNDNDGLPIDPTIADPNLRAKNLEVWELHRIFYAAVIKALADEQSWPSPPQGDLSKAAGALGGLLDPAKIGSLLPALQSVLAGLKSTPGGAAAPLPNPGAAAFPPQS